MTKEKLKTVNIISAIVSIVGLLSMIIYGVSAEEISDVTFHIIAGITFTAIVITSQVGKYLNRTNGE